MRFQSTRGQRDGQTPFFCQVHGLVRFLFQFLLLAPVDGEYRHANTGTEFQYLLAYMQRLLYRM